MFGSSCNVDPSCDTQLLGGATFPFPQSTDPCATQLFFPLLNGEDFGSYAGGIPTSDFQERVTYRSTELHFTIEADFRWILSAQDLAAGDPVLAIPWRCAVGVFDDDEIDFVQLPSLFSEDWLTRERILWSTGGRFLIVGAATVDNIHTRTARIRKPVRLTLGQGVYILWELGCVTVVAGGGTTYLEMINLFGSGPLRLQGWHRTFFVT